jgi:hypothetical protein
LRRGCALAGLTIGARTGCGVGAGRYGGGAGVPVCGAEKAW